MLYLVVFIIFLILFLVLYYVLKRIQKLNFIQKINNKYIRWIISLIPIITLFIIFNYVDFVIILFHLMFFIFIFEVIILIIQKFYKRKFKYYYAGIIGIIITIVYLSIGMYLNYHVRYTNYTIYTEKDIGTYLFRIIQISDAHIGTTFDGNGLNKYIESINNMNSDIIVITGDFVDDDTRREDMIIAVETLGKMQTKQGIYYVNGNHDKGYSNYRDFTYNDLKEEFNKNNIIVLEDEVKLINDDIYLIGRKDRSDKTRKMIDELINNLNKDKYMISLNHQPNDYQNEVNKVDLVLSGHTHGGQLFPLGPIGLLIGANDEYYGLHQKENTYFIVNSGISDWKTSFKTGTFSEIGIIDIRMNK